MAPHENSDHDSYVRSGFAGTVGWGNKPALLLVDVCNAYWSKGSPLDTSENPASAAAPASIAKLVDAARKGQVPLIWTRVEYTEPDMSDAGIFYCKAPLLKVFLKGNETGLESWVPGLEPRDGELIVSKRYPSAFFATDLSTRLQLKGVDTLVICGVSTSGCVRATTLDAMCLGYRPIVGLGIRNFESGSPPHRSSVRLAEIGPKRYTMRMSSISRRKWQMWCLKVRPQKSLKLAGYNRYVVNIPIYSETCNSRSH
ncbi:Isochorismatase-like protein [Boeremia exigua]|uniref:Isochorismatase-like protein n=1 Tax=Boeremia exigua TaxID=749465 RepID=UPI001E8E4FA3|nr:Isochorismatase-like protein [Boeremia exigua]KAH6611958.1 Isochorismatase-like protein [Boeremia exigua]